MQPADPIIRVRNITKTYKSGDVVVPALNDVTLDIHTGDFLIITGRNGAGKSTLMHNLAVLDSPDTGSITINSKEVVGLSEKLRTELRLRRLGYIFQEYALIAELTALENVMLPAMMLRPTKQSRERAMETLRRVGIERLARRLPSQLSGGEQQKVAIARALVNDPEILFADEPTANLDTVAAKDVLELFVRLNRDRHTIVMVTHEPEETKYANRLIRMVDGAIADNEQTKP